MDNKISTTQKESAARILVVDDHPNTAMTLARAISQLGAGVEVMSATSGKEAIEYADGGAFDVVITDMMMPGINGLELIEHLQAHPGGRPTHNILITAYDVPGLKESARRLKVNEVIIKPVRPEHIYQIVHNILEGMGHTKTPAPVVETHQSFKILIADDMPDNITLLSRYMQSEGYGFITATNGVDALQKIRSEMPDLILLDINMPQKDGFAVLEELRGDPEIQYIPVIILTAARLTSSDIQSGLNLGADDYVTKPFDKRELFARIRTKLRVKEAEDAIRRRNRELSVLPEIAKELSARLDIDDLLSVVLHRTVETLGALVGHIVIFDPVARLQKTYKTATAQANTKIQFPQLMEYAQVIEETRQSRIIDDVSRDPNWHADKDDPTRSAVIVPMFGRDKLLGLLVLGHEQSNYFKIEHLILLQAIISQATIAVENARLYADTAQQQRQLNAVLQSAADAILLFDERVNLLLSNPAGQRLFTDFDSLLGKPLADDAGYDPFVQLLKQAQLSREFTSGEVVWPDQRTFSVLITHIQEGGYVVILHDVSNFIKLEQVKNEFIATASHDLKNPITTLTGFIYMLDKAGPLNDKQMECIHRMQSATHNMDELVQNMLELAKMDLDIQLKNEEVDLYGLVEKLEDEFQPQAGGKQQTLRLVKTKARPKVQGDAFQLHQALSNLIGNAIKYTPAEGTITLSVERESEYVKVNVRDTGYGIPQADLPYIFDRFYRIRDEARAEIEGNGLGLAIVKSIAEKHGGNVAVESQPGQGTCFSFSMPVSSALQSTAE